MACFQRLGAIYGNEQRKWESLRVCMYMDEIENEKRKERVRERGRKKERERE